MTLIVARNLGSEIRMYSDAKISYPDQLRNSPLKGALKLVTTNDVCIGYAGNYHVALDSIREISTQGAKNVQEISDFLFDVHKSQSGVDFIIATYTPKLNLIKISDNVLESQIDSAWIGDHAAFSEYQKIYHSASPPISDAENEDEARKYEIISRMGDSMGQLVREGKFNTVGDFFISVRSTKEGFRYLGNAIAFMAPQVIPPGHSTTLKFGTAQQGGYAYTVLWPSSANTGVIAVHFHQGNIGALYHPLEKDEALVFSDVSFDQFKAAVLHEYGIHIDGIRIS
jgi:hypothetical protein